MGLYLIAYDVADDGRRERLSLLLSGYGPRVQMSVFESEVKNKTALRELKTRIRQVVDRHEDQVRVYPIASETVGAITIIGARTIEERADYWIVR